MSLCTDHLSSFPHSHHKHPKHQTFVAIGFVEKRKRKGKLQMAEAILEVLLENLSSFIRTELGLFFGVNKEIDRLASTLTTIRAVLEDAEEKQFTDRAIKNWLQKLKDAAHKLEDILDECSTEALQLEYHEPTCGWTKKLQGSCLSSFHSKNVLLRQRIAKKMKEISETLHNIGEERKMFDLREIITLNGRKDKVMEWRQTTSIITEPQVYGREEEKEKIVQTLIGHVGFEVYPIVGIGGLGKTTLAQLVFNDERVNKHFELKIWTCVSDDFSLKRLSKAILESASLHACPSLDLDPLLKQLQNMLHKRRYLLVLDDVWNEDQEKWSKLKFVLACGSIGSSILVTTRLDKVACIMGTLPPHHLFGLSDDDLWLLFKQRAFGLNKEENTELVAIGKEIVKKCKGMPLAAKALGGLLHFKSEEEEWLYVKESAFWNLPQDENSILPALRLSYLNLPLHLRRCFAYCAIFPKDSRIFKEKLIYLWMANGLIPSRGKMMVEEVAGDVFNELYWRSFFQDIIRDEFGNILWFKMHDLVHDLAQSVMEDARGIGYNCPSTDLSGKLLHLSISFGMSPSSLHLSQFESLRTYLDLYCLNSLTSILPKLHFVRALSIEHLDKLPSVNHLKHLRYLNLSSGKFKKLPECICSLWNLQVLDLSYNSALQMLPYQLKLLKSLRHLLLTRCTSLNKMSPEMGKLTSLRTLNIYIVGKRKGFLLLELESLDLKGKLHIKNLENARSVRDASEANLVGKKLDELILSWSRNHQSQLQENVKQILGALEPHPKVVSLGIGGYNGDGFPHWMGDPAFKNLTHIWLMDCKDCFQLPALGKLPSLKELRIHNMPHVQYIDDESYNRLVARTFPSLESLSLSYMPNLKGLAKEGGEMFPHLLELAIAECPELAFPCLPSVRKLRIIERCDKLHIGQVSALALPHRQSITNVIMEGRSNQSSLNSIHNLKGLEFLWLYDDEELTSYPQGMLRDLTCLKELHIFHHIKLEVLPTEHINFSALEELYILGCQSLESFTEEALKGLNSLQRLKIDCCDKFKCLSPGFQHLRSLKELIVARCPEVVDLSDTFQHIPFLESLSLYELRNIESSTNWLGSLSSLQSLSIVCCPKLMCLPLSIQCLASLKSLTIAECPELQKRFGRETGEEWHKISQVSHVDLGTHGWGSPAGLCAMSLSINRKEI